MTTIFFEFKKYIGIWGEKDKDQEMKKDTI